MPLLRPHQFAPARRVKIVQLFQIALRFFERHFVRAAFVLANSVSGGGEAESVSQFFHILGAVDQQRGCCEVAEGEYEITIYTSCCNADKGIYYYTTYGNSAVTAVDMHREDLDSGELAAYPMLTEMAVNFQN